MISNQTKLICKYSGRIERANGRYFVEIPKREIEHRALAEGDLCSISIHVDGSFTDSPQRMRPSDTDYSPPVSVGDQCTVEIEDLGNEGDGIARVDEGYVLIVPETSPGDEVRVEITETSPNVGFAEVVADGDAPESATDPS